MNPTNSEKSVQHKFDYFCKKLLKNETIDYRIAEKRRSEKEVTVCPFDEVEGKVFATMDNYFAERKVFNACGLSIIVYGEKIIEALNCLPEKTRNIILLSYFLNLSDSEVGKMVDMGRSNVQYHRIQALKTLRKFLEGTEYD